MIQISKDKTKVGELPFMRNIHDRDEMYKIFGTMVTICAKEKIFKSMF